MKRVVEITLLEGLPRSHRTFSHGFYSKCDEKPLEDFKQGSYLDFM